MYAELFDIDQQPTLIRQCYQQAKQQPARIVFPDAVDIRVLRAARYLQQQQLAQPILLANPFVLREEALKQHFPLDGLLVIDPVEEPPYLDEFITYLMNKLKAKALDDLVASIKQPLWFAAAMLATGKADYCIAGNLSSTASVLRAGLKVVGLREGIKTLSSVFIMLPKGEGQPLGFADCGVVPQPTAAQLADIAISSAENFEKITGQVAKVAMLSFSTKGSAKHPCVANVQQATEIIRERVPSLCVDGELQFDAAFVSEVGQLKAPDSPVAGQANVFIFPSLEAGNIGYKIAQRLGGYSAIGPLVQGLNAPMHDLSRGCSYQEIIELALVTMAQGHHLTPDHLAQ